MLLARILNRSQHAFDAALAESAGDEQSVILFKLRFITLIVFVGRFQALGFDPIHFQLEVVRERAVHERLFQRLVAVFILDIFSDNADFDHIFRVVNTVHQIVPLGKVAILRLEVQTAQHQSIHFFMGEYDRHFVNRCHVFGGDYGLVFHVAEQSNLGLDVLRKETIGAAQQDIGLNSDAEKFFYGVLGRLGLQFLRRCDKRHQRHMYE